MKKTTAKVAEGRMISESRTALDEIVRQGARRMLQEALEQEVTEYLAAMPTGELRMAGERSFATAVFPNGDF